MQESNEEYWARVAIPEYKDSYIVSSEGKIENIHTGKRLEPSLASNGTGYLRVTLSLETKRVAYPIHKIVALTFLGKLPKGKCVNHMNGNKLDNRIENLEYVTPKENAQHAVELGLCGQRTSPMNGCYVQQFSLEGEYIQSYPSFAKAARETFCQASHISAVCAGKRKQAGSFIWKRTEAPVGDGCGINGFINDEYPNYIITRDGHVYNRSNGGRLKHNYNGTHPRVNLTNKLGKQVTRALHRLVALTYLDNPENHPNVYHKDGNTHNNHVDNLCWGQAAHESLDNYKKNSKRVYQYTREGEFIQEFESVSGAAKHIGVHHSSIRRAIKDNGTSAGFLWKHEFTEQISDDFKTIGRTVMQYSTDGEFIQQFSSASEASRQLGFHQDTIQTACRESKIAVGFLWKYKDVWQRHKPVCQYNKFGELLQEFPTITEASKMTGIHVATIAKACNGSHVSHGFLWGYKDNQSQ